MNTEHTKHPCEAVEASADVMKLAEMILSDCGCSTSISDRLQRRVAGRIQLHMDSALGGQQAEPAAPAVKESLTADRQAAQVARQIIKLADDHFENGGSSVLRTANNCIAEIQELAEEAIADRHAAQAPAMADNCIPVPAEWIERLLLGDRQHHIELRAMLAAAPQAAGPGDAAKDAARYRWLRETPSSDVYVWDQRGEEYQECGNQLYGEELDSAIDAAMLDAAPQGATEGCGAYGDGCQGQGCRLERESPPTCQTCNGKGMIGGLLPNGGGYDGEPCPDCAAPQATAEDSSVVPRNVAQDAARYRLLRLGRCWSVIDGLGAGLQGEELDAAVDVALGSAAPKGGEA